MIAEDTKSLALDLARRLDDIYGPETPTRGAAGGEGYPRRTRLRTLMTLAEQKGESPSAIAAAWAARLAGWEFGSDIEALDALAAACGICKECGGQ